ncbi:hypothetical protein [Mucilaginibacter psychrotolerans]|uniref:Uncharacterized protein n=1 Tax=Mucilaginibacter psychrotolerans TaxID=1524096 RepID=A0A4Y8SC42_9SPHI|nr:hypothetical protein [Mucilaginibacter psychrotolerans]TFF36211.1 hypothetical protein E2R66_16865 [Mucilaginibacter psychrotolerans]
MLARYYRIDKATGIHIHIGNDGSATFAVCGLELDKDRLDFKEKAVALTSINERKDASPAANAAVIITGKGVLIKQLARREHTDKENFSDVLTNADIDDFYVQDFISGDNSHIAVIRRTEADRWLSIILEEGYKPLMLCLGPFPVEHIINQLNVYGVTFEFNGHSLRRNAEGVWLGYKYAAEAVSPFLIKAENEPLDEKLVLAYAAAFQLLLSGQLLPIRAGAAGLENKLQDTLLEKKFRARLAVLLGGIFILLMLNFFVFISLDSSNQGLAQKVSSSAQNSSQAEDINDAIKQNELLLKGLGWDGVPNKTIFIDQLAQLLPANVSWESVSIDPPDAAALKSQRVMRFTQRHITITGSSANILPVNEWIARAKSKPWIKSIRMESYLFDNEEGTGMFTISIDY